MGAKILQQGVTMMCPHGGTVTATPSNTRVKVGGAYALLQADVFTVAGCPFQLPGPTPSPCITVEWQLPANRVTVNGQAVLLETSMGLCKNAQQAVQGPASVVGPQMNVSGV